MFFCEVVVFSDSFADVCLLDQTFKAIVASRNAEVYVSTPLMLTYTHTLTCIHQLQWFTLITGMSFTIK